MELIDILGSELIVSPVIDDQELASLALTHYRRQQLTLNFLERKIAVEQFLEGVYELGEDPSEVLEVAESNLDFVIRHGIELE